MSDLVGQDVVVNIESHNGNKTKIEGNVSVENGRYFLLQKPDGTKRMILWETLHNGGWIEIR